MATKVYFISGLGADKRAFKKITLPAGFEPVYLDWIAPEPNESLAAYANRLALGIDATMPFYLVGLSFGGMIASEIAKKLKPIHIFLISSTPVYKELPWYYRTAGKLRLQKLAPMGLIKNVNDMGLKFIGGKSREERLLLKQLVLDTDPAFMKWALTCILNWRNTERPANLTHIHGNADNVLPIRYYHPDIVINGGGHFMVYGNGAEISHHITNLLLAAKQ